MLPSVLDAPRNFLPPGLHSPPPLVLHSPLATRHYTGGQSFRLCVFGRFVVEDSLLGVLDPRSQVVGFARLVYDLGLLDQALLPEVEKALVEQDHAVLAAGLDRRVDAVRLVLADQV